MQEKKDGENMVHLHEVRDMDTHYVIDPTTMAITNANETKNTLMLGDHDSEIYTFEVPKYIEGHDMSLCNMVEVHYINVASNKVGSSTDVYPVKDMTVAADDADTLVFSWKVSGNATKYAGTLNYRIKFACKDEKGNITYKKWTDVYKGITVADGFDNGEAVVEEYSDILAAWEARLDALEDAVLCTAQDLNEEQKAQARENIGASTYYNTTREELGLAHEDINTEYIYGLYDALMAEYPGNVQKNEFQNDDGTFTNYEYVISTREYPTDGLYAQAYGADPHIKKPKYLVLSGIHGTERNATLSAYRFIRDGLDGQNVPQSFKEGAIIHIVPVGTPSAFDAFTRKSEDEIDINRDFVSETPAKETQAIKNWLNANADADLFIDFHNNGQINEVVAILGDSNHVATEMVKKTALKGVDRIIPFWKDVIGYPPVEAPYLDGNEIKTEVRDVIFAYCADAAIDGSAQLYASNTLDIPSATIEVSVFYGNYSEWDSTKESYPPETIAAGAEAIGNILIEFYEQSLMGKVVDDMKVIGSKLDTLMASVNSGFKVVSGTVTISEETGDLKGSTTAEVDISIPCTIDDADAEATIKTYFAIDGTNTGSLEMGIPCSAGAKLFIFEVADDTYASIVAYEKAQKAAGSDPTAWLYGFTGQGVSALRVSGSTLRGRATSSYTYSKSLIIAQDGTKICNNGDGFAFNFENIKAGKYNWTAYYWEE